MRPKRENLITAGVCLVIIVAAVLVRVLVLHR